MNIKKEDIPKKRCRKRFEQATEKYWCADLSCRKGNICPLSVAYKGKDNFWDEFDKKIDTQLFGKIDTEDMKLTEIEP